jgi:hypothetical protein
MRTTAHRTYRLSGLLTLLECVIAVPAFAQPANQTAASPAASQIEAAELFEKKVAPLLARHCLECHDTATQEGGLDLSRKVEALAGGDSGKVIVPGKASESLLWEYVELDDMPLDRPPLSDDQKRVLQEWIDAGAAWPVDVIDPAAYAGDSAVAYLGVGRLTVPEYIATAGPR